jgi:hypothetical protein
MVGGSFALTTVILKAGRDTGAELLSVTLITMPVKAPMSLNAGVPDKRPDVALKSAHAGLFAIENTRVSPVSTSLAVGVNEYSCPLQRNFAGDPLITGISLTG